MLKPDININPTLELLNRPGIYYPSTNTSEFNDFCKPDFDAKQYANLILQNLPGNPFHSQDISSALSKLNHAIELLSKEIQVQVVEHYEDLLLQVSSLHQLEKLVSEVKLKISTLEASFDTVKNLVYLPYNEITSKTTELEYSQECAETLRHICKILSLLKRLSQIINFVDGQADKAIENSDWIKAALDINQVDITLKTVDLSQMDVIDSKLDFINTCKATILNSANTFLNNGIINQDLADLSTGIQMFFNLGMLSAKIKEIQNSIIDDIVESFRLHVNISQINKEVKKIPDNKPTNAVRRINEPVAADTNSKVWASVLWTHMERLMDDLYKKCIQIYSLEKGLERLKNLETNESFLDLIAKEFHGALRAVFWKLVSSSLDKEIRSAIKASLFLQQTFQTEYPRLLRLFHDFLSRVAVASGHSTDFTKSIESVCILKALSNFESSFLSRSLSKILDPINTIFPERVMGPSRTPPKKEDVDKIIRAIASELEICKFDHNLLKSIGKNIQKAIYLYLIKMETLLANETSIFSFSGQGTITHSQAINTEIINCLWFMRESFYSLSLDYLTTAVSDTMVIQTELINKSLIGNVERLYASMARDLEMIILKIHKEDYSKTTAKSSRTQESPPYLMDFVVKLKWLDREIISKLYCENDSKLWNRSLCSRMLDYFLIHASIVRPLSELGKLKLADEITQLEFSLSQWFGTLGLKLETDHEIQSSYRSFKAFKSLLFLDVKQIIEPQYSDALPPIIVIHHLFVRAFPVISLPPWHFGWNEQKYSEILDTNPKGQIALIEKCLDIYAEEVKRRGEKEYCPEYPIIKGFIKRISA